MSMISDLGTTNLVNNLNQNSGTQLQEKLQNKKVASTDEDLMGVCREFEAYFTEQVFKAMYKMVPENEEQDNSTKQLTGYYQDQMISEYAKQSSQGEGLGIAQMMYEQMKRTNQL